MIACLEGEGVDALHVNDDGRAKIDLVSREGAYLVGVIRAVGICVGMVAELACEEGAVGVSNGGKVGVYGEPARGENQLADLRTQDLHRAVGAMPDAGALTACRRYVGVAPALVVDQAGDRLHEDASAAAAGCPCPTTVVGITITIGNACRPGSTVGAYGDAGIDHDVVALQVDGSARSAAATTLGLVGAGSALAADGAYIATQSECAIGNYLYAAAAGAACPGSRFWSRFWCRLARGCV
mgnify:CR=1 FL=1